MEAWRAVARVQSSSAGTSGAAGGAGCGDEAVIRWFWEAVADLAPEQQRLLLQFWSGSDSVPIEGLASLDPPFHLRLVDRCLGGGGGAGGNGSGGGGSGSGGGRGGGRAPRVSSSSAGSGGGGDAEPRRRRARRGWPWSAVRWAAGGGGAGDQRGGGGDEDSGSSRGGTPRSARGGAGGFFDRAFGLDDGDDAADGDEGGEGAGGSGGSGSGQRDACRLPSAHTCGRVLELPRYESADELREKLRVVLVWAREGMGLA